MGTYIWKTDLLVRAHTFGYEEGLQTVTNSTTSVTPLPMSAVGLFQFEWEFVNLNVSSHNYKYIHLGSVSHSGRAARWCSGRHRRPTARRSWVPPSLHVLCMGSLPQSRLALGVLLVGDSCLWVWMVVSALLSNGDQSRVYSVPNRDWLQTLHPPLFPPQPRMMSGSEDDWLTSCMVGVFCSLFTYAAILQSGAD